MIFVNDVKALMQRTQIILCYNVQLFENLRVDFFLWNQRQLIYHDIPFDFIGLLSVNKIQLLIGDHGFYSNEDIGTVFDITVKKHWGNLVHIIYRRPVHIKFLWTLSPSVVMRVLWNKLLYFKCIYMCKDYFYTTVSQTSHVHFATQHYVMKYKSQSKWTKKPGEPLAKLELSISYIGAAYGV